MSSMRQPQYRVSVTRLGKLEGPPPTPLLKSPAGSRRLSCPAKAPSPAAPHLMPRGLPAASMPLMGQLNGCCAEGNGGRSSRGAGGALPSAGTGALQGVHPSSCGSTCARRRPPLPPRHSSPPPRSPASCLKPMRGCWRRTGATLPKARQCSAAGGGVPALAMPASPARQHAQWWSACLQHRQRMTADTIPPAVCAWQNPASGLQVRQGDWPGIISG